VDADENWRSARPQVRVLSVRLVRAIGLTVLSFILVYAPTSALAAGLRFPPVLAVPFVMLGTFFTAVLLMFVLSRRSPDGLARYGITGATQKHIGVAVVVSVPIAFFAALLLAHAHEPGPLAGLSLSPMLAILYFVVGASIQEEVIFRGLLQTMLANLSAPRGTHDPSCEVLASIMIALLFGCI
jgi:membrane protease YdiL (CAAX protease family)